MPEQEQDFSVFLPLVKVDYQKREIYGRMTQEIPDGVKEVMDYASSKPLFEKWSAAAQARTSLLPESSRSLGNVRLMHQPTAVGKVIGIDYNDQEKAIDIGTHIVDDDAWDKVLKGVLTGFSVGGKYARKWMDGSAFMRYTADPAEVSLVDSPAVPTATFKLIKMDGSEELRKLGEPVNLPTDEENPLVVDTPADGDLNPSTPDALLVVPSTSVTETIPVNAEGITLPDLITLHDVTPVNAPSPAPVAPTAPNAPADVEGISKRFSSTIRNLLDLEKAADEQRAQENTLINVGSRVGIARRSGELLTPPQGYPTDLIKYADPANWSWPYDSPARIHSAVADFNGGKGKETYSAQEWGVLGKRIADHAEKQLGKVYRYNPEKQTINPIKDGITMDLTKLDAGGLLSELQRTFTSAADMIGTGDSTGAQELLRRLAGDLSTATTTTSVSVTAPTPAPTGAQLGATVTVLKADAPVPEESAVEPDGDESMKALTTKVDGLTKLVGDLATLVTKQAEQAQAPVQKNAPMGDLAALLNSTPTTPVIDPVIAALTSGDKYALQKAAELAGSNGRPDMEAVLKKVNDAASESLAPQFTRMMLLRNYNHLALPAAGGN